MKKFVKEILDPVGHRKGAIQSLFQHLLIWLDGNIPTGFSCI